MTRTLADEHKFEVQLPPAEGDNLITNTSGQWGAWQWQPAPSATDTSVTGDPVAGTLQMKLSSTATVQKLWVWSDYFPVTPGKYANARIDLVSVTAGHKVYLEIGFVDADYNTVSYSFSSPTSTAGDTLSFSSVAVPATAAYAILGVVVDHTTDTIAGSGTADDGAQATFTKAMLTELSTAGVPSVVTTNLMPNGGFQYVTTGWSAGTNIGSISRYTPGFGEYFLQGNFAGNALSDGERCYLNSPYMTGIEPGKNYSLRVDTYFPTGLSSGHTFTSGVLYRWYNASNVQIGSDVFLSDNSTLAGEWHQVWKIITAPAGAAKLRLHPWVQYHGATITLSTAWYFQTDSISVVQSDVLQPYFDGDTPDTSSATYAWTGTAGNSTSTRTSVGAVDYVEPSEQYIDVSAGVTSLKVTRSELDVSTLQGTLVDADLSPARAGSVIAPGRGFRVVALDADGTTWRRLMTGTLGPSSVTYDPINDEKRYKRDPRRSLNITITGTGRETDLAQASRPDTALTPEDLPKLALSGAGVPWDIDGATVVTPATSVGTNDNATALDQVALTRDTVGGFAWVNPDGVLTFRSTLTDTATVLAPDAYAADGLKVSFSTERVINSVTVVRRILASDGSTEERPAGPFEDGASIRRWGRQAATVTIASTPDAVIDADIVAGRILAANANPVPTIEEIAVNSADVREHAFHDLYALLEAQASTLDGDITQDTRVVSVTHEITTTRRRYGNWGTWRTTYGFMADGGTAAPAIQPPAADNADAPAPAGSTAMWVSTTSVTPSSFPYRDGGSVVSATPLFGGANGYMGITYSGSGVWTCTTAGTYTMRYRINLTSVAAGTRMIAFIWHNLAAASITTNNGLVRDEEQATEASGPWELNTDVTVHLEAGDTIQFGYWSDASPTITAANGMNYAGTAYARMFTFTRQL